MVLLTEFKYNIQEAENLSNAEMISPILSATHNFCKKANMSFRDINMQDKGYINGKETALCLFSQTNEIDIFIDDIVSGGKFSNTELFIFYTREKGEFNFIGYSTRQQVLAIETGMHFKAQKECKKIMYDTIKPLQDIFVIEAEEQKDIRDEIQPHVLLHLHSEYSVGDGYGSADQIAEELYKKGFEAAAITDHGTLAGTYYLQKSFKSKNIKPIIGYEAYIVNNTEDQENGHLTLLVKNNAGWKNLLKLHNKGVFENFYYKPRILIKDLLENSEGLIALSGCTSGYIAKQLFKGVPVSQALAPFKESFKENFYIELMPHAAVPNQKELNQKLFDYAKVTNTKIVITADSHYPNKSDKEVHEAIKAISYGKKFGEAGFSGNTFYYLQKKDIEELCAKDFSYITEHLPSIFATTKQIADECNFEIKRIEFDTLPSLTENPEQTITTLAWEGLKKLGLDTKPEYIERLNLELERILTKKYSRYFLVVWDYVNYCKANNIQLGVGRGSVGASLLAYCLGITGIDPIEYDLMFDRFLSPARKDAPDIDLDFEDSRRQELIQYLNKKYGEKFTAKIGTYSTWHGKGSLRDIGRIFDIPQDQINKTCNLVVQRSGGDARADFCLMDTFTEFEQGKQFRKDYPQQTDLAIALESKIRHKGVHAAGLIVSGYDLTELVPLMKLNGEIATEWEKAPIEEIGLIKFDILGLNTLTIIKQTMHRANITELPKTFDDKKVYDTIFKPGKTLGVFQFETVGLQKLSKQLEINDFKLTYDATTLYRPGALHSGETADYVLRHQNKKVWTYDHELLAPITKDTKGLILYQEQVMKVMHDLGGFSWATSESARKIMTKSKGKKEFEKMRKEFCENANRNHGLTPEEAGKIFDVVSTFGSYGFNKAHAVEYSVISYWTAWLKTYYPGEFFATLLSNETDSQKIKDYINDMKDFSLKVNFPDINKSKLGYQFCEGKLYAGIDAIKGLGEKQAKKIIDLQPYNSLNDFLERVKPGTRLIKSLCLCGCFDIWNINKKYVVDNSEKISKAKTFDAPLLAQEDYSEKELKMLRLQYIDLEEGKPLIELYEDPFASKIKYTKIGNLSFEEPCDEVWIKGIITFINFKQEGLEGQWTMFENVLERRYAHLNVSDGTGNILVHLSPEQYTFYKKYLERDTGAPVIIKGHTIKNFNKIYCDAMIVLDDINVELPIVRYINGISQANLDYLNNQDLKGKEAGIIKSVSYKVSKNKKPYARINLYGKKDSVLCFALTPKIFSAGELLLYQTTQAPFIKVIGRK